MDVVESDQLNARQAFTHWYYRAKFRLLKERIKETPALDINSRVADVGCGLGMFLTFLEYNQVFKASQMTGIDTVYTAPGTAIGGTARILPTWPQGQLFDLVLMMDVLEHTPDDAQVLGDAVSHLAEGGYIFITVPAFQWLFSSHDRFLGHYRRYSRRSVMQMLSKCPELEPVSVHYYYASIFPLAAPLRLLRKNDTRNTASDMRHLPRFLNFILRFVTHLELAVAKRNHFFGLSVVAFCRKRKS